MIADFLYSLSDRDLQGALLVPDLATADLSVALTVVNQQTAAIPDRYAFLLEGFGIQAIPGAAQVAQSCELRILLKNLPGQPIIIASETFYGAAGVIAQFGRPAGKILCPPGSQFDGLARFSAASVANRMILNVYGWLIPRGNLGSV